MKKLFILIGTVAVLHFVLFFILFVLTIVTRFNFIVDLFLAISFPMSLLPMDSKFGWPGLIGFTVSNSLIWGVCFGLLIFGILKLVRR
jgi:hypothetical protein